jgi:mono/diheme cytochrome c family protein
LIRSGVVTVINAISKLQELEEQYGEHFTVEGLSCFETYSGLVLAVALVAGLWVNERLAPESAPVARGAAYAGVRGCVDCHGDPEYTLPDANDKGCSNVNPFAWHPEYAVNCADAFAYFEAIRLRRNLDQRIATGVDTLLVQGEVLAREYHCFQCHGQLGQGGFQNEKSLKGYVPGYFGNDFKLLTRNGDPESVRAWIVNGTDEAMLEKPISGAIAEFYFARQAVGMPRFDSLPADEIEILVNYVLAISRFGPMSATVAREYGEQTTSIQTLATCEGISKNDC